MTSEQDRTIKKIKDEFSDKLVSAKKDCLLGDKLINIQWLG